MWEASWSHYATQHLPIYLAAAVLVTHRAALMADPATSFDDVLRFCVQLSGRLELEPLLRTAEALVQYAGDAGREACAGVPPQ